MQLKDLNDWPPSTFSIVGSGCGDRVPTHAEQVTIGDLEMVRDKSVSFHGKYDGDKECLATIHVANRETAEMVEAVLRESKGKNLLSIGDNELPTGQ